MEKTKVLPCRVLACFLGFWSWLVFKFLSLQFYHSPLLCYLRCFVFFLGGGGQGMVVLRCFFPPLFYWCQLLFGCLTSLNFDHEAEQITESPGLMILCFLVFRFFLLTSMLTPHDNLALSHWKLAKKWTIKKQKKQSRKVSSDDLLLLGGVCFMINFCFHIDFVAYDLPTCFVFVFGFTAKFHLIFHVIFNCVFFVWRHHVDSTSPGFVKLRRMIETNNKPKNERKHLEGVWKNVWFFLWWVFFGFWLTSCLCLACFFFVCFIYCFLWVLILSQSAFPVAKTHPPPPPTQNKQKNNSF